MTLCRLVDIKQPRLPRHPRLRSPPPSNESRRLEAREVNRGVQLAERVMAERGLDATDATLRNSVVFKVVQALRHAKRRRLVRMAEKQKGMCVWAPGDAITLRVVASIPSSPG